MTTSSPARVATVLALAATAALAGPSLGQPASYSYDELNRLTSATIGGSRIEYEYDAAGNITRVLTPYSIRVTKSGSGTGTVSDDRAKVDCGGDCGGVYDIGATVALTAVAAAGSVFLGWSGSCSGTGACLVTVDGAMDVNASFENSAAADLSIFKSDGRTTATPGETLVYTIQAANAGPSAAANATVSDSFPASLTCTWTSSGAGGAVGSAGAGGGPINESLTLPPGSSMTYTADCEVDAAAGGTLSNTATVSSGINDPNPGNESATDTTELVPRADLWLTKEASVTLVQPGGEVGYTIAVGNRGPSVATSLTVTDVLPSGAGFVSASGVGWSCAPGTGTVACTKSTLPPGQQSEISIVVTAPASAGLFTNQAQLASATAEDAPGDEEDSVAVEVLSPPTIVAVRSVAATETGEILPGTTTASSLTQLLLEVSHELYDPAGDSDPNDATNPGCYRIFSAEPGGTIASASCAAPTDVGIAWVSYGAAGPDTVALHVSGALGLPAGRYRLVVCGTGPNAVQDTLAVFLDGDGDGTAGDDFVRDFDVSVTNLLHNPNLDLDLEGWTVASQSPSEVIWDSTRDASAASTSGSVSLVNLTGSGSMLEVSQCVEVTGGELYQVRARVRAESLGASWPIVDGSLEAFDAPTCGGGSLGKLSVGTIMGDTDLAWLPGFPQSATMPVPALSARVALSVSGEELSAEAWLDDLQTFSLGIFRDGFETGTTSAWSSSVGVP